MKAASHTNRLEERRAQTHAFHPTLRFDREHTTATFGTVVRKYNMHTAETHMLSCTHTHTDTRAAGLQPVPTVLGFTSQQHHLLTPSKDNKG